MRGVGLWGGLAVLTFVAPSVAYAGNWPASYWVAGIAAAFILVDGMFMIYDRIHNVALQLAALNKQFEAFLQRMS